MIILHASAIVGDFVLWGETSTPEAGKARAGARRRTAPARPPRSRFALQANRLIEVVAAAVPGFEVSRVERGIKAQSRRGEFGASWWAKRWIKVLEGFDIGARLARGRSYARSGQVLSISIEEGRVTARVQGSRPTPYDVGIQVKTLSQAEWAKVLDALGQQALFAAKLLAGEMPQDVEPLFEKVGLSLFPSRRADLTTRCSCPDSSNPCKAIAAAYYLLGEEFDRDPLLILRLRGMSREALVTRLEATGSRSNDAGGSAAISPPSREPLTTESAAFWGGEAGQIGDPCGPVEIPREPSVLPRRLGGFPFWRGQAPLLDTLGPIYTSASPRGLDLFLGPALGAARSEPETGSPPASRR
jgi:uncharacterized Zn finger protein